MWTIQLPLRVPVSKKKFFTLNLNQYRNAHHFTLAKAKTNFHDQVQPLVKRAIPRQLKHCTLEYVLYPRLTPKQVVDVPNICSIADKFFSDTLVSAGRLEDDNFKFISKVTYRFGEVDRENPRVDVIIREAAAQASLVPAEVVQDILPPQPSRPLKEPNPMKITISNADLYGMVGAYLRENLPLKEDAEFIPEFATEPNGHIRVVVHFPPYADLRQSSPELFGPEGQPKDTHRLPTAAELEGSVQQAQAAVSEAPAPQPEELPDERLQVACPDCGAEVGEPCLKQDGNPSSRIHGARTKAFEAMKAGTIEPEPEEPEEEPEIDDEIGEDATDSSAAEEPTGEPEEEEEAPPPKKKGGSLFGNMPKKVTTAEAAAGHPDAPKSKSLFKDLAKPTND